MTPLTILAAWSVVSVPTALVVGALLHAADRRTAAQQPQVVPVAVRSRRSAA